MSIYKKPSPSFWHKEQCDCCHAEYDLRGGDKLKDGVCDACHQDAQREQQAKNEGIGDE